MRYDPTADPRGTPVTVHDFDQTTEPATAADHYANPADAVGTIAADDPILDPAPQHGPLDFVHAGEVHARETFDRIVGELQDLRNQRDDLNDRINELVEAEALWTPIINRLDNGIQRRPRKASDDDGQQTLGDAE
jgi:hypothetical protein